MSDVDTIERVATLSWGRIVALVLAFAWLAGSIGYLVASRTEVDSLGDVEVGFLQDMSSHHNQALELSLIALDRTATPEIVAVAREILIGQSYEVGRMEEKLRADGVDPLQRPSQAMGWMGMSVPVADMPGMATEAELDAFRATSGASTDEMFIELMAAHHIGGIQMGDAAAELASSKTINDLATRMADNQRAEVREMDDTARRNDLDVDLPDVPERGEPTNMTGMSH